MCFLLSYTSVSIELNVLSPIILFGWWTWLAGAATNFIQVTVWWVASCLGSFYGGAYVTLYVAISTFFPDCNMSAVEVDEYVRHHGRQRKTISLVLLMLC